MRILIAEDDASLAGFVRKGLEAEDYAVDVSVDGEQARSLALEFDYDLVVLDLNLPRLDGVSILRSVRDRKPNIPILVLTARGRVDDRVLCLDAFLFSELSARIRALLRRSQLPSESRLMVEDLKLDRVETAGHAWKSHHRLNLQGIRTAGVPDEKCGPKGDPRNDYRARVEPFIRHRH